MGADQALRDWLRLTLVAGIGGRTQRKLLAAFGLPEAIFAASRDALYAVIGDKAAALLGNADAAAIELACAWADAPDQHIVTLADADYPRLLLETADPPTLLYVRGRVELLNRPALAIVGSRNPTAQGERDAQNFAAAFAQAGLTIVSGLALGIDAAAHRGALSVGGDTVAFLGTGIDRIYPARNLELAREIGARGAIVSEFPIGTPVAAANFPRRNRLISGVSRGVLVVEAALKSGSLITARLAAEQGRDVFAIPGSIHAPQARGCHQLIRDGAKLVECAQDVLDELTVIDGRTPDTDVGPAPANGTPDETEPGGQLLALLGFAPCGLDELAARSGLAADALVAQLLRLELDGRVAALPGGLYQRLAGD
jgi:DNA processing protein